MKRAEFVKIHTPVRAEPVEAREALALRQTQGERMDFILQDSLNGFDREG